MAAGLQAASTAQTLRTLFVRDLRLAQRRKADTLGAAIFFVIVASLFPIGVGPEPALLKRMGPGVVWVAALLAAMLAMPRLFADDAADGTLEQLLLSTTPLPLLVLAKVAAHWLCSTGLMANK
jgi:heme exporter protein B